MKTTLFRASLLLTFFISFFGSAHAKKLVCEQPNAHTMHMNVATKIQGDYHTYGTRVIFNKLSFDYSIYMGAVAEENLWSEGGQIFQAIANDESYRPRVYKKHMKFNVYISGIGGKDSFGELDLILPAEKMLSLSPSSFKGHLIMTGMDDHFGGTVPLDCFVR